MPVTALPGRSRSQPAGGQRTALTSGPAFPAPRPTAVTVTLNIPLTGESLPPQARRLLEAVCDLVEAGGGEIAIDALTADPADSDPTADPAAETTDSGPTNSGPTNSDSGPASGPDPAGGPGGPGLHGPGLHGPGLHGPGLRGPGLRGPGPGGARTGPAEDGTLPGRSGFVAPGQEVRLLTGSRQVLVGGEPMALTRLEFDLLQFLAGNPHRVFSRVQLLTAVWGYEHTGERTVDVHVRRLRVKMGDIPLIATVYGIGYRLDDNATIVLDPHA